MTAPQQSTRKLLRSRVSQLSERLREHEDLVRALQAGEVDAVLVLNEENESIARIQSDEPLYRTIVDALPQGVATVLSDGTVVYVNQFLATMIGTPAEALLGTNLLAVVAEADVPQVKALLQGALSSPQEIGVSFRWSGGEAPVLLSAMRLPISGVDAVGLVIVDLRDQVARQAAEEASRAKDELLASVSHELRTPLTAVMGWVQLLEHELSVDPEIASALRHMKDAVLAEVKIVDDLLDLARSEKGSLPLAIREFDLCESLRMAMSFVDLQAHNKDVALSIDIPDAALPVRGDPDRLRQVFVNLLSNALKFTPHGEVRMQVKKKDHSVAVEVADSGIGIVGDFLPFLFEPFRRGDRSSGYPGLGLGLAIARRLVEAHGGTIEAASDGPGRGSTFTVCLPLLEADT